MEVDQGMLLAMCIHMLDHAALYLGMIAAESAPAAQQLEQVQAAMAQLGAGLLQHSSDDPGQFMSSLHAALPAFQEMPAEEFGEGVGFCLEVAGAG